MVEASEAAVFMAAISEVFTVEVFTIEAFFSERGFRGDRFHTRWFLRWLLSRLLWIWTLLPDYLWDNLLLLIPGSLRQRSAKTRLFRSR
jgi:hypothetical protein